MLYVEHNSVWCWYLDTSESKSEIPGKFWRRMLEREVDDQLDGSYEKWNTTKCQEEKEHTKYNKTKEG